MQVGVHTPAKSIPFNNNDLINDKQYLLAPHQGIFGAEWVRYAIWEER